MNRPPVPARLPMRLVRTTFMILAGIAAAGTVLFLLAPLATRGLVRLIKEFAVGGIWVATAISAGVSPWVMLSTAWSNAASGLTAPAMSAVLWTLALIGLVALYWLQRLLEPGTRRFDRTQKKDR